MEPQNRYLRFTRSVIMIACRRRAFTDRFSRARRSAPALLLGLLAVIGCREDSPTGPESAPRAEAAPEAAAPSVVAAAFAQVSSDGFTSCAVAADGRGWCWGGSNAGELGDGTTQSHLVPQPVAGNLRFRRIANNSHRACGITTDNRAYCWGAETVGDGTTAQRLTPTAVAGNLRFFQLDVGSAQICGVSDPDRRAYCWGSLDALTPKRVPGGHRFRMVSGGEEHFCGVTTTNQAWCWGSNRFGQVGDGVQNTRVRVEPSRVAGGRSWRQIDAGSSTPAPSPPRARPSAGASAGSATSATATPRTGSSRARSGAGSSSTG
jgi:hypothetical protein